MGTEMALMVQKNNGITPGIRKGWGKGHREKRSLYLILMEKTKIHLFNKYLFFHPFIKKEFSRICRVKLIPVKIQGLF